MDLIEDDMTSPETEVFVWNGFAYESTGESIGVRLYPDTSQQPIEFYSPGEAR